jgi:hypothetical protein
MLINKILWASDGSKDSTETLRCAELLSNKSEAEIVGLFVIPDHTKSGLSQFSSEDAVDARNLIVCFPGNIVMDK